MNQLKYKSIEEAYNKEFNRLVSIAKSHLIDRDYAIDCVNSVFVKRLEYKHKTGKEVLSGYYLVRDVTRQAEHINKYLFGNRIDRLQHDIPDCGRRIQSAIYETFNDSENIIE